MTTLYLGYYFVHPYRPEMVNVFIKLAYGFSLPPLYFLAKFFYEFPRRTLKFPKIIRQIGIIALISIFGISTFTNLIHKSAVIENQVYVSDDLGQLYWVYAFYLLFYLCFAAFLVIDKLKHTKLLEHRKTVFAAFGFFIFLTLATLTNVLLPIFGIFIFQREAVLFSVFLAIPIFYSIIKYRFLDIKFNLFRTLQFGAALGLAVLVEYIAHIFLFSQIKIEPFFTAILDIIIIFSALFLGNLLLQTKFCQKYFHVSSAERFIQASEKLSRQRVSYKTISELEKDLHKTFCRELGVRFIRIIILNPASRQRYASLTAHCHHHSQILVTREIQFFALDNNKNYPYLAELTRLGEVCLPLFHHSGQLAGFFILGQKSDDSLYTEEEITAIEKLSSYLNFEVASALYNTELRTEVKEKTRKLATQNKKNKELVRQQADFIAVTAHELRTPLTIALNYFDSFKENLSKKHAKNTELSVAETALENLQKLIQKIFNVQQYDLDKVKLHLEKTDLDDFLTMIHQNFLPLVKAQKLDFIFEKDLSVGQQKLLIEIDPVQIRQVIQNLLRNALQFEPKKIIRLVLTKKAEGVVIKIVDDGPGISDTKKQQVFEKFQSNPALQGKGIGLGLYICKKIVALHGGRIWIEDTPEGGTTFVISLPLAQSRAALLALPTA